MHKYYLKHFIVVICSSILFMACTTSPWTDPRHRADDLAKRANLTKKWYKQDMFTLLTYSRLEKPNQPVIVYIEGDGLAWESKYHLSSDPTPRDLLVLRLAALDNHPNLLYIARPCQFLPRQELNHCSPSYWSGKRYAPEVIAAIQGVIKEALSPYKEYHLVGYSGGGGISLLIAAKEPAVQSIRTIAGNLDHKALHSYHKVGQLTKSLNPIDARILLTNLPQIHYLGTKDQVIPSWMGEHYMSQGPSSTCITIKNIEGATHSKGWESLWSKQFSVVPTCQNH